MKTNQNEVINKTAITTDEIKLILERYRIGKKPLAKLLGWGETTIIRYMEGDIPTNEYSNKLKAILDDPKCYYDILVKRKDCLTGVAFKKSKKAVLAKIMSSKLYVVAYYIVNRNNAEVSASYVQYFLYYIQAFSLAMYDKELFQEECMYNHENIPYVKLFDKMKKNGIYTLDLDDDLFSPEEKQLIDTICDTFIWYGPKALQMLAIYEKSQLKAARDKYNNKIIDKNTLKEFFQNLCQQYDIYNLKDISRYPDEKLNEIKILNKHIS